MNRLTKQLRASVIAATIFTVMPAAQAAADTLTLMWDLNPEPDVTGYQVHIGVTPGVYTQTVDVGNTDTYAYTDAVTGQQYCFAVTAYAGNLISPLSNEVCSQS